MENLFWAVVIGFSIAAFLLVAGIQEIGNLHKSLEDRLKSIEGALKTRLESIEGELKTIGEELGWKGTIHKELIDIGTAIDRSWQP